MKRLLSLLTAAASPLVSARGVLTEGVDPRERPLRGELRVLPVHGNGSVPSDFCRLGPEGLIVSVRNIGRTPTPPQEVRVTFNTKQQPGL
jgi:hypothetical protein